MHVLRSPRRINRLRVTVESSGTLRLPVRHTHTHVRNNENDTWNFFDFTIIHSRHKCKIYIIVNISYWERPLIVYSYASFDYFISNNGSKSIVSKDKVSAFSNLRLFTTFLWFGIRAHRWIITLFLLKN